MTRATPIPDIVIIHVPFRIVKRGGRKEMQMPDRVRRERTLNNTLVKALARAFRWKRMLESGDVATIADLARREGIAAAYLTRTMRLAHLAPDLIQSILDGHQPRSLTLEILREPLPEVWDEQRHLLARGVTPLNRRSAPADGAVRLALFRRRGFCLSE